MNLLKQHDRQHTAVSRDMNCIVERNIENIFPSNTPQPIEMIAQGICMNCDNLGRCVWQHNNNINCQHYK